MHKNVSERDKKEHELHIERNLQLKQLKLNSDNLQADKKHIPFISSMIVNKANEKKIKICFVCNKIFREKNSLLSGHLLNTTNSIVTANLNKTFVRHMQIQHGLSEKGERLIECPVCEKNFFNRQQMERHMHTHEVWVPIKFNQNSASVNSSSSATNDRLVFEIYFI